MPLARTCDVPRTSTGRPAVSEFIRSAMRSSIGKHAVPRGFDDPKALKLVQLIGHLFREVVRLRPILRRVVQLPHVIVERRRSGRHDPGRAMPRDRRPAFVINSAIAEHFEVLGFVAFGGRRVVEAIAHADALHRNLSDAIDHVGLGKLRGLQDRRGHVDDVMKLMAYLALSP